MQYLRVIKNDFPFASDEKPTNALTSSVQDDRVALCGTFHQIPYVSRAFHHLPSFALPQNTQSEAGGLEMRVWVEERNEKTESPLVFDLLVGQCPAKTENKMSPQIKQQKNKTKQHTLRNHSSKRDNPTSFLRTPTRSSAAKGCAKNRWSCKFCPTPFFCFVQL
jgi:hypothetical protein